MSWKFLPFRNLPRLNAPPQLGHADSEIIIQTRMKKLLDDIFTHDNSTYISFTTHSGSIASLLRITGHREFRLPTGAVIPVLIKAEMTHAEPS